MVMKRRLAAILGFVVAGSLALSPAPVAAKPHSKDKKLQPTRGKKTPFEFQGAILARPDDTQADPTGTHKWSGKEAGGSPVCSAHFCVHWTATGQDASNASYATQMRDILENEVYPCENGSAPAACAGNPGLGWRDPPPDYGLGGSDQVDVYIEDLYDTEHVYGYTALDPGQAQDPTVPHFAYMVMDNDYSRYGGGSTGGATGVDAERVTAAHEYNHVLQNGYDYLEDPWMFEATAVYMEDKVYPDINDYLNYVNAWVAHTDEPLTVFSSDLKPYGSAVWNHWLDHRYGSGAVRAAWEDSIAASNFAPAAYSDSIAAAGGGGFADEFDQFAAAVAEWDVPGVGFPDRYPDVPRNVVMPVETQFGPFNLPHTTFAYFDVPIPQDSPPTIRLTGTLPDGVAGAVALVGRTGTDPNAGTVTTSLTPMPSGGTAAVHLDNPSQFGRITGVIVNSDTATGGFDSTADDYIYTHDATGVTVAVTAPGPPVVTTGAAGSVTDHTAVLGALVDPHINDTTWEFEYGTTTSYGSVTKAQELPGSTVGSPLVAAPVSGLKASTTYHYRVRAANAAGAVIGTDMTFTTARDVTPPRVFLRVWRQHTRTAAKRGVVYFLRCSERCSGHAELVLPRRTARRLHLPMMLARSRIVLAPHGRATRLLLHVRRGVRPEVLAIRGKWRARLTLRVADAARNRATAGRVALFSS